MWGPGDRVLATYLDPSTLGGCERARGGSDRSATGLASFFCQGLHCGVVSACKGLASPHYKERRKHVKINEEEALDENLSHGIEFA